MSNDITVLAQRFRHWSEMAALTSERVSCLSVEQLEEIAKVLESRTVTVNPYPLATDKSQGWTIHPDFLHQIRERIGDDAENYDFSPSMEMVEAVLIAVVGIQVTEEASGNKLTLVNDVTTGKQLTITLPDISSKAFWSGTGKHEVFHPETYKRWSKEAIERACVIARIEVEVK